jgi:hypothetical protein
MLAAAEIIQVMGIGSAIEDNVSGLGFCVSWEGAELDELEVRVLTGGVGLDSVGWFDGKFGSVESD